MASVTKTLYDTDFSEWTAHTAELLRQGRFEEIDLEHVAEEIDGLGKSDFRAARSQLRRLMMHLIKEKLQADRDGASWRGSITNAQLELLDVLRDSPSLRGRLSAETAQIYASAAKVALIETGSSGQRGDMGIPDRCPFTLTELLESHPDSLRM